MYWMKTNQSLNKHDILTFKFKKMPTLDETLASVTANATVGGSLIELFRSQKARLDELLSGTVLAPGVQEKIDAIFTVSEADKTALEAAILENTPNA